MERLQLAADRVLEHHHHSPSRNWTQEILDVQAPGTGHRPMPIVALLCYVKTSLSSCGHGACGFNIFMFLFLCFVLFRDWRVQIDILLDHNG